VYFTGHQETPLYLYNVESDPRIPEIAAQATYDELKATLYSKPKYADNYHFKLIFENLTEGYISKEDHADISSWLNERY